MPAPQVWLAGVAGIIVIGGVDYMSGTELRTFPLYFAPVSFVAWHRGQTAALIFALLSTVSWALSNVMAGMTYSTRGLWVANALVQGVAFTTVGVLIARLRAAIDREQRISRTDPVTSVLNSRAFDEESGRLLALCRRKRRPATIAYIDLDHFKTVNDTRGHGGGDDVLRRVAQLVQTSVRPSDVFARLGGDEFALLLPEAGAEDAQVMLERLRLLIAGAFASGTPPVTVTIGAVTFLNPPATLDDIVRFADARMYAGKSAGRNRVHLEVIEGAPVPGATTVTAPRQ